MVQEDIDLNVSVDKGLQKLIDTTGAGASLTSPGWLTQLGRLWGGKSVRVHAATASSAAGMHACTHRMTVTCHSAARDLAPCIHMPSMAKHLWRL